MRRGAWVPALVMTLCSLTGIAAQERQDEPVELGIEERIEVDYVLVDFIVLDAQGQPVSDLKLEQFKLKVGGIKTPISTLDRFCPDGAAEDVPAR